MSGVVSAWGLSHGSQPGSSGYPCGCRCDSSGGTPLTIPCPLGLVWSIGELLQGGPGAQCHTRMHVLGMLHAGHAAPKGGPLSTDAAALRCLPACRLQSRGFAPHPSWCVCRARRGV